MNKRLLSKSVLSRIRNAAIQKILDKKCDKKIEYLNLGIACEIIIKDNMNKKYDILIGRNLIKDGFDYQFDKVM